ncbi:ClpXP protease specificity-enhancing factor [Parachitinimonas caeni]|uniref:ClpXP protease specificity-enhancing factor n=1 Tax=Parachitinimonas caeni TaxID=3031301 RepID=A0ABT7DWV7_9NEIS|nr:ClpXP protease specificity-enhancing factor [Parachitinimonas caeni]MDK2123132.1 ClpXP protease specificity-enhancing factor [Parachitinimonas caeni]
MSTVSTKPYLIRAIHEWCSDHGFTPYLVVAVKDRMQVPMEYVKNGEIVLNISYNATRALQLGNDFVRFSARFGGVSRDVAVPIGAVVSIFARENGEGMAFEPDNTEVGDLSAVPESVSSSPLRAVDLSSDDEPQTAEEEPEPPTPTPSGKRPSLRIVK